MSEANANPAFVSDDGSTNATNGTLKNNNVFTVELTEIKGKDAPDPGYYVPYEHRIVEHPTTNSETLLHLLKGSLGTGILAMPHAFKNSGYVSGLICTAIIGFLCTYCIHLLIKAEYELCKRRKKPSMSYPETAELAFAEGPRFLRGFSPFAGHMVNIFLLIYQLGTCCVYIVFISTNVKAILDEYIDAIDLKIYMVIFLLPLVLINWIRNLKLLAPFSTFANVVTVVGFVIIIYYTFHEGIVFDDRHAVGEIAEFPLYFGTVLFALEAIGVIMPLENEMKTPKSFGGTFGILNIGMVTIICLYMMMGFLGYLAYGDDVEGSITLNLAPGEPLAQAVKGTLALAIFITFSLQCYVAVDITWNQYLCPHVADNKHKLLFEYIVRTVLVLITFLLAVAIPKLELFISLFGALCLAALGIAIPAVIDLCTYWYNFRGSRFYVMLIKNSLLILFGVIGLVVGTYTSLYEIIKEFT